MRTSLKLVQVYVLIQVFFQLSPNTFETRCVSRPSGDLPLERSLSGFALRCLLSLEDADEVEVLGLVTSRLRLTSDPGPSAKCFCDKVEAPKVLLRLLRSSKDEEFSRSSR